MNITYCWANPMMVHTDRWKIEVKLWDKLEMSDSRCEDLLKNYWDYFAITWTDRVKELQDENLNINKARVEEAQKQKEEAERKKINQIKENIFRINEKIEEKKQKQKEYEYNKNRIIRQLEADLKNQRQLLAKHTEETNNEILNLKKQIGLLNLQINK